MRRGQSTELPLFQAVLLVPGINLLQIDQKLEDKISQIPPLMDLRWEKYNEDTGERSQATPDRQCQNETEHQCSDYGESCTEPRLESRNVRIAKLKYMYASPFTKYILHLVSKYAVLNRKGPSMSFITVYEY